MTVQIFKGRFSFKEASNTTVSTDLPFMNFDHAGNSLLALFQITTTENWTTVLFDCINSQYDLFSRIFAACLLIGFYCFVIFVVINTLVAVFLQNFDLDDKEKLKRQLELFVKRHHIDLKDPSLSKPEEKSKWSIVRNRIRSKSLVYLNYKNIHSLLLKNQI
jgi:hypothetical protein